MGVLNEGKHAGEFIHWEQNGYHSREQVTIASGAAHDVGAIMGSITASKKYAGYDPAGIDGTEVAAGILFDKVNASAADAKGVLLVRDAALNYEETELQTHATWTDAQKAAVLDDLAALGITFRNVPQAVIDLTTNGFYGGVTPA